VVFRHFAFDALLAETASPALIDDAKLRRRAGRPTIRDPIGAQRDFWAGRP